MSETVVNEAKSDAMQWQVDARHRGDPPLSPEDMYKEAARTLGSPGAATAVALLATAGLQPTPLDDDLKPSSGPLGTYRAIHEHYRNRHHDGVGVGLGEHPGGTVLVAQYGTAAAWAAWQKVDGAEVHRQ